MVSRNATSTASRMAALMGSVMTLSGCATVSTIANVEPVARGDGYQAQYRSENTPSGPPRAQAMNVARCAIDPAPAAAPADSSGLDDDAEPLSRGDLVAIRVGSDEMLSGDFKVSQDGALRLPHLPAVRAEGLSVDVIQAEIAERLIDAGFYRSAPQVSVRITDAAGARVYVSGAVFEPGAISVGGVDGKDVDAARQRAPGWVADGRRLSRALQSAGGVRPDADLARVSLRRGETLMTLDVRKAISGQPYQDIVLQAGDLIDVPSRGCFQENLMKPTPITALGIKVFMSNLTTPASSNSASAIGKDTTELRYGARLMQAMVGMNCVGGAKMTNADRYVVLLSRNPVTGASTVLSRRIEDLVARADRDDFNPYLLPGDAMACYDSTQTNVLQVANALGSVMSSAVIAAKF